MDEMESENTAQDSIEDQSELLSYLRHEEDAARQYQTDELQPERELNFNRLLGRPMGNEEEGRSQVVSTDVWDAIEGMLPSLLKPFTSTDEFVKFSPVSEEDVPAAEQETDYINYIISQKNNGYMIIYQWFWDALVNKYGIVEYGWEEDVSSEVERYRGIADEELALLLQNPDIELEEINSQPDPMAQPVMDQMGMPAPPPMLHDVTLRITTKSGQAKIHNVPPEEFIFNADLSTQHIKDARFVQREVFKTLSDIRELGYEVDDDIVDDGSDYYNSVERSNRYDNWRDYTNDGSSEDGPNRLVLFKTTYCRHDLNDDGIAELIKVVRVGDTILEMEEAEEIPFSAIHCHVIPHKFAGVSTADVVVPIQDLKTTLWRQALDNIYGINSNRVFVSDRVNLDDMLSNPLGGIIRVESDSAAGHVSPAPIQPIGGIIQPMIEYADTVKENRTGFTRYSSGMDADSLNKTLGGITKIMDAAQQRMELMARTFAETGFKDLMLGLHGLARRHATKQEVIQLRNKWVPVDPRNWKTRKDMTVSVGLGTGDKQQMIQNMQIIGGIQQQVLPLGMADKKTIYNAIKRGVEAMGYKDVGQFILEPEDGQIPPPKPDPDSIKAKNAHVEKMLTIALDAVQTGVLPVDVFVQGFMMAVQQDMPQPQPQPQGMPQGMPQ